MPKETKLSRTQRLLQRAATLLQTKMRWHYFKIFVPVSLIVIVALLGLKQGLHVWEVKNDAAVRESQRVKQAAASSRKHAAAVKQAKLAAAKKPVDWHRPSEDKPYPDVNKYAHFNIEADLKKQRVFLKNGDKVLYTMYASSGMDKTTPTGHFTVEPERGTNFFNYEEQMGANYYTSFHDHGVYLFHTVPTDIKGKYITKEANYLGKKPSSHGCIRLSIPDAKWIFETVPVGTKVVVHN